MTSTIAAKSKPLPAGVYVPVISLYRPTPRQEIDLDAAYKHFTHMIRGGIHGIVLAGTNAEAVLLNPQERRDLVSVARKAAQDLDLPNYPLVAGISGQSTNESIKLAQEAAEAGAGWALLLPPSYWVKAVTKDVILSYYREVADLSPIPVVIYSVRVAKPPNVCLDLNWKIIVPRRYQWPRHQLRCYVRAGSAPQYRGSQINVW
jgi:dihydrodipicolinate synthase/N-acetylneuraminate lyase